VGRLLLCVYCVAIAPLSIQWWLFLLLTLVSSFPRSFDSLLGSPELKKIMERAKMDKKSWNKNTMLFLDEIHRLNKAQQGMQCVSLSV
jgi:hypothetical protein